MDDQFYEIFRAGNYPQRSVSAEDIAAIAANYDASFQEAPISIFHWGDGYAYGWIKELKAEGDSLMACFKDVTDDLKELVALKKLKNHSIELYEDLNGKGLYLKALAMLGTEAPAVKGMNPIAFTEGEAASYKFEEVPAFATDFAVDYYKAQASKASAAKTKAEKDLEDEKKKSQQFSSQNVQIQFAQRKADFESFLDQGIEEGKFKPVLRDSAISLFTHLDGLEAAEGEEKTPLALFKEFVTELKTQIQFGEQFDDGQSEVGGFSVHELADEATKYQEEQRKAGKIVSISTAVEYVKNKKK